MSSPLLSVGVPLFNQEKFIEQCLTSLVAGARGPQDLEVLAVDDGSTDRSPEIVKELAELSGGIIKYIRQENSGVASAVNRTIDLATGRYFRVVDADDYVDSSALSRLIEALSKTDVDLVLTDFAYVLDNSLTRINEFRGLESCINIREAGFKRGGPRNCNAAFKTHIAKLCPWKPSLYSDSPWIVECLSWSRTMSYVPVSLYRYRRHAAQSSDLRGYQRHVGDHEASLFALCDTISGRLDHIPCLQFCLDLAGRIINTHCEILLSMGKSHDDVLEFLGRVYAYDFARPLVDVWRGVLTKKKPA